MKHGVLVVLFPLLLATACGTAVESTAPDATQAPADAATSTPTAEAAATEEPTSAPTDSPEPTEATTSTPTAESAPTEASAATLTPAPTTAPQTSGTAGFRDSLAVADQFVLNLSSVPAPPDDQVYQGWLVSDDGTTTSVGVVNLNPVGNVALEWNSPSSENLLGRYARFEVTLEVAEGSTSPTGQAALAGGLEGETLANARRLFVKNEGEPATPLDTALALGLGAQTDVAVQHVQNAVNAAAIGSLPEMRIHLEHVVNIIEGAAGPRFDDHDGNGVAENPGDGFGVIGYSSQIAQALSEQQSVATAAVEVETQSAAIQDKALEILIVEDLATATAQLAELKAMADQLKAGPVADLYVAAQDAIRFEVGASP